MTAKQVFACGTALLGFALLAGCKALTEPKEVIPTLPPADASTLLLSDDFDNENAGEGAYNWTEFRNWNVLKGCVDLHGNGFNDVQPGKGLYVDLDGTCKEAGTLETKAALELQPGNYVLEFWLAGNQRVDNVDTVDVSLGSLYQRRFILRQKDLFALYSQNLTVAAPTSAKLRFTHHGGDDHGILLDLVRLRRVE